MNYSIGDVVTWDSQAQGSTVTKAGTIIAIVPPDTHPNEVIPGQYYDKTRCYDASGTRKEVSYLVAVPTPKGKSCHIYWPRVRHLRKVETAKTYD